MSTRNLSNKILYGGGILFDLCKWVILATVMIILVHKFIATIFIVDGMSMEPTIHDKELVVLRRYIGAKDLPKRQDVVAVKYPGDPENKKYIKRVIGLPGDLVEVKGGFVYVDGNRLGESYIGYGVESEPGGTWNLDDNQYFLMGDNRPGSNDSRYFGPVEKRFFMGEATMIIFPRLRQVEDL